MSTEEWLRKRVTENHFSSRFHGGIFAILLIIVILAASLFRRTSPSEWVNIFTSSSSQDRSVALSIAIGAIPVLLVVRWLLSFLPTGLTGYQSGWQGQLTGREMRSLYRAEDRLTKKLQEIYKSVPQPPSFNEKEYKKASEKLEKFQALRFPELEEISAEPWFKILVVSGAIGAKHGSIIRVVDIRAVKNTLISEP